MAETEIDRTSTARVRQLDTLDRLAQKFGQSLQKALSINVGTGRQLDSVLGTLTTKLSNVALKAALKPVKAGITRLVNGLMSTGAEGEATAFARGGVLAQGRVRPFAQGGVVAAPTYFPMRDGLGLMGEAGPEAILPLRRGADGRLGVAAGGGGSGGNGSGGVTVHIATPDIEGFRRSEAQVAASLARAVARGRRGL
ncbi:phage tail tape measure protein [Methylobacterium flocculans]|uniref:phage tail tape measure protein n=1 Tax=Methylobacterium flocculans TaxID=2984843 RepID=UPI0021F2759E|nr:phage tail tape measure protein [Methylobacterium sp. FF17]